MILDGKAVAARVLDEVRAGVTRLRERTGVTPTLAVVLIGDDPASQVYVRNKKRAAELVGIASRDRLHPGGLGPAELLALLRSLNADPAIHGILLQLPLPTGLDEDAAIAAIAPAKDADGLHPENLGRLLAGHPTVVPCTPAGCLEILDHYGAKLEGAEAVVVGRSSVVGRPAAHLLSCLDATVTLCHSRTRDLGSHLRRADIVVAALGRPRFIRGEDLKPGATVIDAGVNVEGSRVAGDVDFESASRVAAAITPVPGGVGPVTTAMLLSNAVAAAERRL